MAPGEFAGSSIAARKRTVGRLRPRRIEDRLGTNERRRLDYDAMTWIARPSVRQGRSLTESTRTDEDELPVLLSCGTQGQVGSY